MERDGHSIGYGAGLHETILVNDPHMPSNVGLSSLRKAGRWPACTGPHLGRFVDDLRPEVFGWTGPRGG